MDSGKVQDDEVDIFDLVGARQGEASPEEHIETETNVFSVDALKRAAAQYVGGEPTAKKHAADAVAAVGANDAGNAPDLDDNFDNDRFDALDDIDDLDDDAPEPKKGFFARLIDRLKGAGPDDGGLSIDDDLPLDDDVSPDVPAAAAPTVTDSGVFELGAPTAEAAPKPEPEPVAAVPDVTDSGVFELGSDVIDTPDEQAKPVAAVPDVTDSGVFELGSNVIDTPDEQAKPVAAVPDVTDSGIFEFQAPPTTSKAVGGGEWEIGWEPEDDKSAGAAVAAAEAKTPDLPPPTFTKIAHVCLYVDNLAKSVEFYGKLGFQKRFVFNRNGNLFGAYLEFGGGNFIELFEDPARAISAAPGRLAHFCLETPDIEAATASLSARGIGFTPKKLGCDSTYQIWLKDPDGNEFEIHQYTPESSQIVGGTVEADWQ
jgi:lactoylglutathione lyase/glyoxylase I family protein